MQECDLQNANLTAYALSIVPLNEKLCGILNPHNNMHIRLWYYKYNNEMSQRYLKGIGVACMDYHLEFNWILTRKSSVGMNILLSI